MNLLKRLLQKLASAWPAFASSRRRSTEAVNHCGIAWLHPWCPIEAMAGLANELKNEIVRGHILNGLPVRSIARRAVNDDVLFEIEDGSGRVALVHPTWNKEPHPDWPAAGIYPSLERWAVTGMRQDHLEPLPQSN